MPTAHYKRCNTCGEDRPAAAFTVRPTSPDGRGRKCELCRKTGLAQGAKVVVAEAVKSGTLTRPEACEKCGEIGRPLEAHHHDYTKPLEVLWLCRPCHRDTHRGLETLSDDLSRAYMQRVDGADRSRKRRWDRKNAAPCVACGTGTSAPGRTRCQHCEKVARSKEARARFMRAHRLRAQGMNNRQVAAELGETPHAIGYLLRRANYARFGVEYERSPYFTRHASTGS